MKQAIIKKIDKVASIVNALSCGHSECEFGRDNESGWPPTVNFGWCGSCIAYWHLCEAKNALEGA